VKDSLTSISMDTLKV
jgi:acetyl esterase/lipase